MYTKSNKKGKPYTESEIEVIKNCIRQYPNNLKHAFEEAASHLRGRTKAAISSYYYGTLRHAEGDPLIAIGSSRGMIVNSKNSPRRATPQESFILDLISELTDEERKRIAKAIFQSM